MLLALALALATAAGAWWAARAPARSGWIASAQSLAEGLGAPGMLAYMLTGGVHASPLPDWAIIPFVCGASGLIWAALAAGAVRGVRGLRRLAAGARAA